MRAPVLVVYALSADLVGGLRRQSKAASEAQADDDAQGQEQGEVSQVAAAQRYVTVKGCTCKADSQCKSDIGTKFRCDTCKTEGSCGTWSLAGRWDYCDYRPNIRSDFISQSWDSKMSYFWKNIAANTTQYPEYPLLSNLLGSVVTVFDNYLPEMPAGREKMIHTVGSVCQFELSVNSRSPYTGLLAPGRQRGLIRLGSAVDPGSDGVTPGLGFKFPRSGVPDGDFVTLHTLDTGNPQWNFFFKNQSTHTAPTNGFPASLLVRKFKEATDCVFQIGVSDLARYSQNGREHATPRFPFKIMAAVNPQLKTGEGELTLDGIHKEIDAFPVGTVLYSLWACGKPVGDEMDPNGENGVSSCGDAFKLGDIRTTSQCTTSWYGDASLHFRHTRIEEDWKLEPSYMRQGAYDVEQVCMNSIDGVPPPPCGTEGMLNSDA